MHPVLNPYLPLYEYIPDGEPHVFGDRVYVYGSHDRFDGRRFCLNDYVCYSAPVTDLSDWRYEGVIYGKTQDPRMRDGKHELWAPDVVRGKDGRYYLYYCPDDSIRSIGVAVSDTPAGRYEFLGVVHDANGGIVGERPGDTIAFDPGVFLDDDGEIYLYSGNGPREVRDFGRWPKASTVMTLQDDMVTLKSEPRRLLPTMDEADGTDFAGHAFFEASSIRKFNGIYYLVYSSVTLHELCYATSNRPDGGFRYGGVLVSNCDLFPNRGGAPKTCYGNNHGGLERINGAYYIFYHRQTNRTMFSRQGCAERVELLPDGRIEQVEMTSCGLNGGPLPARGAYPAAICCELYGKHTPVISHPFLMGRRHPYLTQDGPDWSPGDPGTPPMQYIANLRSGGTAVYRSFAFDGAGSIAVRARGSMRGELLVKLAPDGDPAARIALAPAKDWTTFSAPLCALNGVFPLYFCYTGRGTLNLSEVSFSERTE